MFDTALYLGPARAVKREKPKAFGHASIKNYAIMYVRSIYEHNPDDDRTMQRKMLNYATVFRDSESKVKFPGLSGRVGRSAYV